MKSNEFKCGRCKEIFTKGRSDEEAEKEAQDIFGKPTKEWKDERVSVCDDCFKLMDPRKYPDLLKEARKEI